jgi:hypothetical protein
MTNAMIHRQIAMPLSQAVDAAIYLVDLAKAVDPAGLGTSRSSSQSQFA